MFNQFYAKYYFTNGMKYMHHNLFLVNLPFLIAPVSLLSGLLLIDDNAFQKKIYSSIRDSVKSTLMKNVSLDFGFRGERLASFLRDYFTFSGWGNIQIVDLNIEKTEAIITVSDNPFVSHLGYIPKAPVDSIFRGIFAGIFSRIFEKDVDCVELHCSVLGAQNCEFVVKPQNAFDLSNKLVLQQLEFDL